MSEPLYDDPVVGEIHAIRAKMLADCGGDPHKLMQQVRDRQKASGRQIISRPSAARRESQECADAADREVPKGESHSTAS
jgi:hypothetical protein